MIALIMLFDTRILASRNCCLRGTIVSRYVCVACVACVACVCVCGCVCVCVLGVCRVCVWRACACDWIVRGEITLCKREALDTFQ